MKKYIAMARRGYEPLPDLEDYDPYDDDDDDDDDRANQTTPFIPGSSSKPKTYGQQIEMKTMQKEKSGLPETSYAETSFGGRKTTDEELTLRLAALRRDAKTGLLDTTKIPNVENPLTKEEKQKEIQRLRDFIKARFPKADFSKLVMAFSSKKPMDIVLLRPKGGEAKIALDNGSGLQKSF